MQTEGPSLASPAEASRELHRQASTWLIISLVSSVLFLSLCLGIGGAVFCYLSMQAARYDLLADAEAKLKWGKILTLVGSSIGIISTSLSLIFR